MVPGSTLRYGSSFCIVTCKPRAVSNWPRLDAVRPLPSEETTPPVTKRCLVAVCGCLRNAGKSNLRDDGQGIAELAGACRPTEPHLNTDADKPSLTRPAVLLREGYRCRALADAVLTGPPAVDQLAQSEHRCHPAGLGVDVVDGAHRPAQSGVR